MNYYIHFYSIALLFLLSGCSNSPNPPKKDACPSIIDLNASTKIIMHLITTNSLAKVLEACEQEDLNRLVKNFSPAQLALEAEALNWPQPVILFFMDKDSDDYQSMHHLFEHAAREHEEQIKFIEVDSTELFKLTEDFNITELPALSLMSNRQEIRCVQDIEKDNFERELQLLIKDNN